MSNKKKLSAKQQLFVVHYCKTMNKTEAAKLAGYSERTAYRMGFENFKKPHIFEKIQEHMADVCGTVGINKVMIVQGVKAIFEDETTQVKDRLKASEILLNTLGLNEKTLIDITTDGQSLNTPLTKEEIKKYNEALESEY